jgi:hypothetical protein
MSAKRAIRDFSAPGEMWRVTDRWAEREGFRVVERGEDRRRYQKGHGIAVGSRIVDLRKTGEQAHLEAWVHANGLARAMSLFILPAEITVESNGMKAALPRRFGRTEVNHLLEALGQGPIT